MCYPWRCPGRWPVCIQLYGHGAEAPIDGYCTRILAFRGLSACQGSLNSSKIVVNEMVLTCLKCPWIQCFQGIIRFWLDFSHKILRLRETANLHRFQFTWHASVIGVPSELFAQRFLCLHNKRMLTCSSYQRTRLRCLRRAQCRRLRRLRPHRLRMRPRPEA